MKQIDSVNLLNSTERKIHHIFQISTEGLNFILSKYELLKTNLDKIILS